MTNSSIFSGKPVFREIREFRREFRKGYLKGVEVIYRVSQKIVRRLMKY